MQPQAVTVVSQNPNNDDKFLQSALTQMKGLSITQIVFGCLCFLFGIIVIVVESGFGHGGYSAVGYGIWIGIYFILVGGIGLGAVRTNVKSWIIGAMVLNIISASLFWLLLLSMSSTAIGIANSCSSYFYYRCTTTSNDYAVIAFNSLMLLISLGELVVSIWSAVLCCGAVCDCCKGFRGNVYQYNTTTTTAMPGQPQVVVCSTSPYVAAPGQVTVQSAQYPAYPTAVHQPPTGYPVQPQGPPGYYASNQNPQPSTQNPGYSQPAAYPPQPAKY